MTNGSTNLPESLQKSNKLMGTENPVITPKVEETVQHDATWNVVVFDDPVNLMEYVTKVFSKVFGYPRSRCEQLMQEVHQAGKALVWSGERERAELYTEQLHGYQLRASIEKAE